MSPELNSPQSPDIQNSQTPLKPIFESLSMRRWKEAQAKRHPILQKAIIVASDIRNGLLDTRDNVVNAAFRAIRRD